MLFFPLVNVDGYCAVERDRLAGRRRFRRGNARGVDLNRNFPTHFRAPRLLDRLVPVWNPGPRARSEPEIDAVVARIDREVAAGAMVDRGLSLHSVGNKILHAYGGRWAPPVAIDRLRAIARSVRDRMHAPYEVLQSSRWVPGALRPRHGARPPLRRLRRGGSAHRVLTRRRVALGAAHARRPVRLVQPHRSTAHRRRNRARPRVVRGRARLLGLLSSRASSSWRRRRWPRRGRAPPKHALAAGILHLRGSAWRAR
ncbi:MAG: hypothetical protein IPJ34_22260 [Myxococcales bacterium]|nr:hypothetical protein [Myxococcales bacterium]